MLLTLSLELRLVENHVSSPLYVSKMSNNVLRKMVMSDTLFVGVLFTIPCLSAVWRMVSLSYQVPISELNNPPLGL